MRAKKTIRVRRASRKTATKSKGQRTRAIKSTVHKKRLQRKTSVHRRRHVKVRRGFSLSYNRAYDQAFDEGFAAGLRDGAAF